VGGSAQKKAMRKVSGKLRLTLAQYRELIIFSQFGADIDPTTKKVIDKGARLQETLKQPQSSPYKMSEQVVLLMAAMGDYQSEVPLKNIRDFNTGLLLRLRTVCPKELTELETTGAFTDAIQNTLTAAIEDYAKGFKAV
jgi:F-type H+-transporting ATPase subunit alpha